MDKIGFLLDGEEVLNYDRSQALPEQQRVYLDNMDDELAKGFVLVDKHIEKPDFQQRTQFVALNCVNALLKGEDQVAIIMFTYLVNRMADLQQVKAKTKSAEQSTANSSESQTAPRIGIEFIFDEVKAEGQKIHFQGNSKTH